MGNINDLISQMCPNGCEYKSLDEISNRIKGMTGVSNKWADKGNCQFIDYLNVYNHLKVDTSLRPFATVKKQEQTSLKTGDILITSASETPDECALSAVIENDIEDNTFLDDHLFGIRINDKYANSVNPSYVNYYFHSGEFRRILPKAVRGVTRYYISLPEFMELEIPIPPLPVQEEIVRILDRFTELEAELEAELEMRKKQYEYYRDKMLSLSDYDGEVKESIFSDLCDIQNGFAFKSASFGKGASKVLKITNIGFDGNIVTDNMITIDKSDYPKTNFNSYEVHNGNIVIALSGATTGKISRSKSDDIFLLNQRTAKFLPHDDLDESYLYHYLSAKVDKFLQMAGGGAQPNLSTTKIEEINIVVPADINEQKRIASVLDKFSTLTEDISEGLPAEIKMRHQQYEYYRDKLLAFKRLERETV